MAISRYAGTQVIDNSYGTYVVPSNAKGYLDVDFLAGLKTKDYVIKAGDRADNLAARFFGNEEDWWVILLVNNMSYPFASGGFKPGVTIKIPNDVSKVKDRLK